MLWCVLRSHVRESLPLLDPWTWGKIWKDFSILFVTQPWRYVPTQCWFNTVALFIQACRRHWSFKPCHSDTYFSLLVHWTLIYLLDRCVADLIGICNASIMQALHMSFILLLASNLSYVAGQLPNDRNEEAGVLKVFFIMQYPSVGQWDLSSKSGALPCSLPAGDLTLASSCQWPSLSLCWHGWQCPPLGSQVPKACLMWVNGELHFRQLCACL